MIKKIIIVVIGAVIVAGGSFYGGMKYDQSKSAAALTKRAQGFQGLEKGNGGTQGLGQRNGGSGANFTSGEIIGKDDKSITIKLLDGGSKIVFYSGTTEISKFTSGTAADLENGKSVIVNGSANQDGSVTAQSIQIRPVSSKP